MTWAPSYATPAELRTYLRLEAVTADATDIAQDTLVYTPALATASREIDDACRRQFGSVTSEARYYTAEWYDDHSHYILKIDDTQATLTLAVDLDDSSAYATAVTDFRLIPKNATQTGKAVTGIVLGSTTSVTRKADRYKATSAWGWTAVPATIKTATLIQAARLVKRRDAPFGVAGSPEFGNELRLLAKLDPDVDLMVRAYKRYV